MRITSGYLFFSLEDPKALAQTLRDACERFNLLGTILLSEEGINLSLSGSGAALAEFRELFHSEFKIPPIEYQEREALTRPFEKLVIRVRPEIIGSGFPEIRPDRSAAMKAVSARELKEWIEE